MRTFVIGFMSLGLALSLQAQVAIHLQINSTEGVHFVVTDPSGRRTGADPRGVHADTLYKVTFLQGIPGASYVYTAIGSTDSNAPKPPESHEFMCSADLPTNGTPYKLEVIGAGLTSYSIDVFAGRTTPQSSNSWSFNVRGAVERDSVTSYKLFCPGADSLDAAFMKMVDASSLLRDITAMRQLGWITSQQTSERYISSIGTYSTQAEQNNLSGARSTLLTFLQNISSDSGSTLTVDACKLLRPDVEYLLRQLPTAPPPGLAVKLINSTGTKLTGGSLQYYDGSWKDATNNNDGAFSITTSQKTLSLRMTYEFATQTKSNVTVGYDTVAFQTVNAQVKLQNSQGTPIDTGMVQYYFSSWKTLGSTSNGVASKELLPGNYTFRMTYASASNDKQQDIGANPVVLFQTVNASVQLKNSQGALMPVPLGDQGTVQYYFSSWKSFGVTTGGVATKELLPGNYTFRIMYAAATNDKQQNIGTNATVVFQTVSAAVQLKNSQGGFIDQGTVQYYFSSWNNLGVTTNGIAAKELLPGNYTFRMTYAAATNDKQQNIGTNSIVLFQTVNATVQLQSSLGSPMDQGTVQYYFSSWNNFGSTFNGVATKELLPGNYTFRMTYAAATNDKQQNISTNPTVLFQTVNATVQLRNSLGSPIDQGTVQYYFSSWNNFGTTTTGVATKELLPGNYTFRMTYETATNDKQQNIGTNPTVVFQTVNAIVQLRNSQGVPIDTGRVQYYFSSWRDLGTTSNGAAAKELLPANYTFRMTHESVTNEKAQNISTNSTVSFSTVLCTVSVKNGQSQPVDNALISFYFNAWRQIGPTVSGQVTKELLPANLTFRMVLGSTSQDKVQNMGTSSLVEFVTQ